MNAVFSIWSGYYHGLPTPEDAILAFLSDGISAAELSHEHAQALLKREGTPREIGERFAAFLAEHSFSMPQGHLSYTIPICAGEWAIEELSRQIDLFAAIGIKSAVVHCDKLTNSGLPFEERLARNVTALRKLTDRAKGTSVRLCIENLRPTCDFTSADDLLRVIDEVGSPILGICLDTGHLNISGASSQREFILRAADRLWALHIADNDTTSDQHLMPFARGTVNFGEVVAALREIHYDGLFNYEIPGESCCCPMPLRHDKARFVKAGYEYLMAQH